MESPQVFNIIWTQILTYWWVVSPIVLFFIFQELWLGYKTAKYLSEINWIILEIRLPRRIERTVKAMDHIFAALHAMHVGDIKTAERYFEGKVQEWLSLEIVGAASGTRFLIRLPDKFKNLAEAQIYAQYPSAEIKEVDDYTAYIPSDIPNQDYDLWGTELILTKSDPYPILTYPAFEGPRTEQSFDPLSSLMEVLSLLKEGEQVWVQLLAKPIDDKFNKWKEEGEKEVAKLAGREVKSSGGGFNPLSAVGEFFGTVFPEVFAGGATEQKKDSKEKKFTPGEESVAKAIEHNVSKLGYEVQIRVLYIAPTTIFSKAQGAAILGSFKQFNTQNLNGFKPNKMASLKPKWYDFNKPLVERGKKKGLLEMYKKRDFRLPFAFLVKPPKNPNTFVLSTEELATVYHMPTSLIQAPAVVRLEAKKSEPPPILPLVE
ncbi:hypothetical protein C4553_00300 [Candidatus Parcubacteria bacterium]|nr:MAG: hypothetical protein C4553_00300 [Candidatus Parcubacteria bacterium]